MPSIVMPTAITAEMKEAKQDYYDRHTPHVEAPARVAKGRPFRVAVSMGRDYPHPDLPEHYIRTLQLFDGERLLASAEYAPGAFTGGLDEPKGHSRAEFQLALAKPARLTALSYCTLHGTWQSEEVRVEVE